MLCALLAVRSMGVWLSRGVALFPGRHRCFDSNMHERIEIDGSGRKRNASDVYTRIDLLWRGWVIGESLVIHAVHVKPTD